MKRYLRIRYFLRYLALSFAMLILSCQGERSGKNTMIFHVWESIDIKFNAEKSYENPYVDVECGVLLSGPGFEKKIYGCWNGGNEFLIRVVATKEGMWHWESFSNQDDDGLNEQKGSFRATEWTEKEILDNPNRKGFIHPTPNRRGLQYANGEPFFMLGDTWWAASTWRFPLKGTELDDHYIPAEGVGLEQALHFRKNQGYNTIAMIAAYPNWYADSFPAQYINKDGIGVRQAWEKNGLNTGKDMHDDEGNMPFEAWGEMEVVADYDRINPEYFKNLDKKIQYMSDHGFVIFLETVRRDHGPSWKHYFDFKESYSRYVQYIASRYGAYNIIFSGIHLDWINKDFSLSAREFNDVLTYHFEKYGPLPFEQPHTILIDGSTLQQFGHGKDAPWLNMHSVGNVPRNHGFYPMIEALFALENPYPVANLEPYYPGWDNDFHNVVAGERPLPDSERDHYFARAQMYGSVLSGGLAGHIYGTGAYCGSTIGEPRNEGERPSIWEGLNYSSGAQMQYLGEFICSEGDAYLNCSPSRELLRPHKNPGTPDHGLDGWSYMLLSSSKELAFLYFEQKSIIPTVTGLKAEAHYTGHWFNPRNGKWLELPGTLLSDSQGEIQLGSFPGGYKKADEDWCLKLTLKIAPELVIFDTDMGSDCGDVGALALLHSYEDEGRAKIIGCLYSSGKVPYGAGIIDAINVHFGRADIPVGACHDTSFGDPEDKMLAAELARDTTTFKHTIVHNHDAQEATMLARRLLSEQDDHSVTYLSVGHTRGLHDLLVSKPDEYSDLSGLELVEKKVKCWIALGALGASNPEGFYKKDWNFFFNGTADYTEYLVQHFTRPVYFVSAGGNVYSGASLSGYDEDNILRKTYETWLWNVEEKKLSDQRPSWDLIAVYFAIEGTGRYLEYAEEGYLKFHAEKGCLWVPHPENDHGNHHLVKLKENTEQQLGAYFNHRIARQLD